MLEIRIVKTFKTVFKLRFLVYNNYLNLCGQVEILNGYCIDEKQVLNEGI